MATGKSIRLIGNQDVCLQSFLSLFFFFHLYYFLFFLSFASLARNNVSIPFGLLCLDHPTDDVQPGSIMLQYVWEEFDSTDPEAMQMALLALAILGSLSTALYSLFSYDHRKKSDERSNITKLVQNRDLRD